MEIEFACPCMIYFSGDVMNHNLNEIFEIVAIATKKSPTHTMKDVQKEVIRGKFYEEELIRVI